MPGNQGGPNGPYIVPPSPPPPPPPPPVALYIPDSVRALATPEQLARIAEIELEFGQRVAKEVSKAYADVLAVVRGKARDEK